MMTARFASGPARLMKEAVLRLTCCAVLAAALLSSTMPEVKAAVEGVDPDFVADVRGPVMVNAVAVHQDGNILIGGNFTTVGGVARDHVARLFPDGALDASFNPNADSSVLAIALQADGGVLIGGEFATVGGASRASGWPDCCPPLPSGSVLRRAPPPPVKPSPSPPPSCRSRPAT